MSRFMDVDAAVSDDDDDDDAVQMPVSKKARLQEYEPASVYVTEPIMAQVARDYDLDRHMDPPHTPVVISQIVNAPIPPPEQQQQERNGVVVAAAEEKEEQVVPTTEERDQVLECARKHQLNDAIMIRSFLLRTCEYVEEIDQSTNQSIMNKTSDASKWAWDQLELAAQKLNQFWRIWRNPQDFSEMTTRLSVLFNQEEQVEIKVLAETKARYTRVVNLLLYFFREAQKDPKVAPGLDYRACIDALTLVSQAIHDGFKIVCRCLNLQRTPLFSPLQLLPSLDLVLDPESVEIDKLENFQMLLILFSSFASQLGLRKRGSDVYEPRHVGGVFTHSYKFYMTLDDFVRSSACPYSQIQMWRELYKKANNATQLVNALVGYRDRRFPSMLPDRDVFAFPNGLYFCSTDTFMSNDSEEYQKLSGDVIAAAYHDVVFENDRYEAIRERYRQEQKPFWYLDKEIAPLSYKLYKDQAIPDEAIAWGFATHGRMCYKLNSLEHWEIVPVYVGQQGSGKSTQVQHALEIYEPRDVIYMSNRMEQTFGLMSVVDQYVFGALDIDEKWTMDRATFMSIVSGEHVERARKGIKTHGSTWTQPGEIACVEPPDWSYHGFMRRALNFAMTESISGSQKGDSQLGKKLRAEMGADIKAWNCAYLEKVALHGNDTLSQDNLPKYFTTTTMNILMDKDPIMAFLACFPFKFGSTQYCEIDVLQAKLREFCEMFNIRNMISVNSQKSKDIFKTKNITLVTRPPTFPGDSERVYKGISLVVATTADSTIVPEAPPVAAEKQPPVGRRGRKRSRAFT